MKEKLVELRQGPFPKKYTAFLRNNETGRIRRINFGDRRYQQYKDRTGLGLYSELDHGDRKRMRNYYRRHSGVKTRKAGLEKEWAKARRSGLYTAKLLSHIYLW